MKSLKHNLFIRLIEPHSVGDDSQRRELITNILLVGIIGISTVTVATNIIYYLVSSNTDKPGSIFPVIAFTLVLIGLWSVSRKGHYVLSAYGILIIMLFIVSQLLFTWSFELPTAILGLAMIIVVGSVTLSARYAINCAILIALYEVVIGYLQTYGPLHPNGYWLAHKPVFGDSIGYGAILIIIGLVSWLANRETDSSLERARRSEAALEAERDSLEIKVAERTAALKKAQMERVMELQQLAEFGRMSAGVLHDVSNPLTAAALDLKQLSDDSHSELARQAMRSLQLIERFIVSARRQLKSQETLVEFNVRTELKSVLRVLDHRFRSAGIQVKLDVPAGCKIYGDPSKFNQIAANLLINAVEAYDEAPADHLKQIRVTVTSKQSTIILQVLDHGRGLDESTRSQVFEPFYSTKAGHRQNMGIGLTTVKQLAEKDFSGRVIISDQVTDSTCFEVHLHNHVRPKAR